MEYLTTHWCSSLEKIFPQKELTCTTDYCSASALCGEVFSLQLAYKGSFSLNPMQIQVVSPLKDSIQVRQVVCVPALALGEKQDDNVLMREPGVVPDLLTTTEHFRSPPDIWHAIWLTVRLPRSISSGKYPIALHFEHFNPYRKDRCFEYETTPFELNVLAGEQPESDLRVASWFYGDCIYRRYGVAPWSEAFYALLENYWRNMTAHGENVIYVPLVTPPLDTWIGGERPTLQSVQIVHCGEQWQFDFTRLERYMSLALTCGMKYFEFSHLFTQWGSEFAPKVMISSAPGAEPVKCMGWKCPADSPEYMAFLEHLLPALRRFLEEHHWFEQSYFHVSDEPSSAHLENYRNALKLFRKHLAGGRFLDAVSHPEFVESGLVDIPVPGVDSLDDFMKLQVRERWSYYCVSQWNQVPNQFASMPSARNRILGLLAYCYNLQGFLHWGYNFWFAQFSTFEVDPYCDPCSGNGFPPGDGFKVYPGPDGHPEDSIRHEVYFEAFQDLAALRQLEEKIGRERTLAWIQKLCGGELPTMHRYPREAAWLLRFRGLLNQKIS